MTEKQRLKAFKKELRELLKKHDASLGLIVKGDTYGTYDEGLGVSFLLPKVKGDNFRHWTEESRLTWGYCAASSDIE